ncbi:hypothetical protein AB0H00_11240 [Nocardia sp. NPDC023852]|uniref:hypothetical protein n=1 Tax=Nocardia sp. NPDC023852 TaxID=3154697 RepID=UPI0033FC529F
MRLSLEPVWSHTCRWTELAIAASVSDEAWERLRWDTPWSVSCRVGGREVSAPVRDLGSLPMAGREPVRGFSWRHGQRHRSGLQYLVSTGRHHGYESLAEARLLLMLDFAGAVTDVLSRPLRLRYVCDEGRAEHVSDFLVTTVSGWWLIDVRPVARIRSRDEVAFAATAEVAALNGWGYVVVGGWQPHAAVTVDTLSAQRRLGMDWRSRCRPDADRCGGGRGPEGRVVDRLDLSPGTVLVLDPSNRYRSPARPGWVRHSSGGICSCSPNTTSIRTPTIRK